MMSISHSNSLIQIVFEAFVVTTGAIFPRISWHIAIFTSTGLWTEFPWENVSTNSNCCKRLKFYGKQVSINRLMLNYYVNQIFLDRLL